MHLFKAFLLLSIVSASVLSSRVIKDEQPDAEGCSKHITGFTLGVINIDTKGSRFAGVVPDLPNPDGSGTVSGIISDKGMLAQDFEFWLCDPPNVGVKSNDSVGVGQFRPVNSAGKRIGLISSNVEKRKQALILVDRGDPSTYTWYLQYFFHGSAHAAEFATPLNHTYKSSGSYHVSIAGEGSLGWKPHRGLELNYVAGKTATDTKKYRLSLSP